MYRPVQSYNHSTPGV